MLKAKLSTSRAPLVLSICNARTPQKDHCRFTEAEETAVVIQEFVYSRKRSKTEVFVTTPPRLQPLMTKDTLQKVTFESAAAHMVQTGEARSPLLYQWRQDLNMFIAAACFCPSRCHGMDGVEIRHHGKGHKSQL